MREIAAKMKERERYVAEILQPPEESTSDGGKAVRERHEKLRQIDDFLKGKRRYVEVYECILSAL